MRTYNLIFTFGFFTILILILIGCAVQKSELSPEQKYSGVMEQNESEQDATQDNSPIEENLDESIIVTKENISIDTQVLEETSYSIHELDKKLFASIEQSFEQRDIQNFQFLSQLFSNSFPYSDQQPALNTLEQEFFYTELLDTSKLKNGIVNIMYPAFENWEKVEQYFKRLKQLGIKAVQWEVTQPEGKPILTFTKRKHNTGLFFDSPNLPVVDIHLDIIVELAHRNGIQVYAALPLRKHPWLQEEQIELLDATWNPLESKTTIIPKLDLINPQSFEYLNQLIHSILNLNVDGIIFKDDFTYDLEEGFSNVAQKAWLKEKKSLLQPEELFTPFYQKANFNLSFSEKFFSFAEWKAGKVYDTIFRLIESLHIQYPKAKIGIEITPNMMLDKELGIIWYSVNRDRIVELPADFFILKWRKQPTEYEVDYENFEKMALFMREFIREKQEIILEIPLNQESQNHVNLNIISNKIVNLTQKVGNSSLLWGPINRLKNYRLLDDF